jgi:hypothetical protein
MYRKLISKAALTIALGLPSAILAADKHGHDHAHKPLHGGIIAEAGDIDAELVARADSLTVHVLEHGKPLATAGAKAIATIHSGNDKFPVVLEPAGENRLAAKGSFKTGVGVRVALGLTLPSKPEARFNFRLK